MSSRVGPVGSVECDGPSIGTSKQREGRYVVCLRPAVFALSLLAAGCSGTVSRPTLTCTSASTADICLRVSREQLRQLHNFGIHRQLLHWKPDADKASNRPDRSQSRGLRRRPFRSIRLRGKPCVECVYEATISVYSINSSTGVLIPTTPATVATGFFPQGIGIDPSVSSSTRRTATTIRFSMFTINPSTGMLTPTTPPSVATGRDPLSVTVNPSGRFALCRE